MSSDSKPKLCVFSGSCWAQVPLLAIQECAYPESEIETIQINLPEGENFKAEYLKITEGAGTIPCLVVDGKVYNDSISCTRQIISSAPHPPRVSPTTSREIIDAVHADNIDPNAIMLMARSKEELEKKKDGMGGFLSGRQKTLDEELKNPKPENKAFLEGRSKMNKEMLDLYTGSPSDETLQKHFATASHFWAQVGEFVRGPLTSALKATEGPFLVGKNVGEADFHVITYLARIASNAGAPQGGADNIKIIQEAAHGKPFDEVVFRYWKAWVGRESFGVVGLN